MCWVLGNYFFLIFVEMGMEHNIAELLYRYNCVVVPGFGAFLTQLKSAVIHSDTNTFYPPTKVLSFNEQLSSNDGLLVSYMANAEKTSYEEMLQQLDDVIKEWKIQMENGERLVFPNIGELWLNTESMILEPGAAILCYDLAATADQHCHPKQHG